MPRQVKYVGDNWELFQMVFNVVSEEENSYWVEREGIIYPFRGRLAKNDVEIVD